MFPQDIINLILSYLEKLLGLPILMLKWPAVLHSLLIPLFLFSYALKLSLDSIGIFSSSSVNWTIALMISLAFLLFIAQGGPFFASAGISMIFLFKLHGTKGIIVGLLCGALYFFIINPLLVTYLV